jgi:hypothetical protein
VAEKSKRVVSNEERFLASYLNPASLLNLTPEIVDRLFNAYQTDLPRKVDFVDAFEHMSICISDMHMSVYMPISDKLDSHSSPIVDLE